MVRFLLTRSAIGAFFAVLFVTSKGAAQPSPSHAEHRLMDAMNEEDAAGARRAVSAILRHERRPGPRAALACMEAFLLECVLSQHLDAPASARESLIVLARDAEMLDAAYTRCHATAPAGAVLDEGRRSRVAGEVGALRHASAQARAAAGSPNDLGHVFREEFARIGRALAPGLPDAWARAEQLHAALPAPRPPPPVPPAPRRRSMVPVVGTGVLVLGFGFVSFMSTLAGLASEGGIHRYSAAGWGLTFGLLAALPGAYAWEQPKTSNYILAGSLTTLSALTGAALQLSEHANRRFLGRGLLIGAGVNLLWTLGARLLYGREPISRRFALGPWMPPAGAGLSAGGRF